MGTVGFYVMGLFLMGLGLGLYFISALLGALIFGNAFLLGGLWVIVRGPRTALTADSGGFVLHTMVRSSSMPWCQVADLSIGVLAEQNGARSYGVLAHLNSGRNLGLGPTSGHRWTANSRDRLTHRLHELLTLRASHRCAGECRPEYWFTGSTPRVPDVPSKPEVQARRPSPKRRGRPTRAARGRPRRAA
ncbi:hypothetical protein LZ495_14385, partial [Yinghuangia sp. KLBMP8922]|nr:hypothetical protein [Yinghuangia soli]